MVHRHIRKEVVRQLKKEFPNWKRLPKKTKKELASKVLKEVVANYDFSQEIETPLDELLGIEEQTTVTGIFSLEEMEQFIQQKENSRILRFCYRDGSPLIKDEELQFIDQLINDNVINSLLAGERYDPYKREILPSNLFRAELLKAVKYPEISYRKFCTEEYFGRDRKQNRVFAGLSLSRLTMIDHTQLSRFRSNLNSVQLANLMVYFLHLFRQSGLLGKQLIFGVDSTELANDCSIPLASIEVLGQKIRIYGDLDCDCGVRRNKRDKSPHVVGYRQHTLTLIDVESKQSFPIASLIASANHHDSKFLPFLVKLAQAMGFDLKLVTADQAYNDSNGSLHKETGTTLVTPESPKVKRPENTDPETGAVFCHGNCEIPMQHIGCYDGEHEYKCNAEPGECMLSSSCSQYRLIATDRGSFQRIPSISDGFQNALDIRKNCERTFNLLKNQTGMENLRVRSQKATLSRCTFSSIGMLLIKMAGYRKKRKPAFSQPSLLDQAANY